MSTPTMTTTMAAVVQRGYGTSDVLSVDKQPMPVPRASEVRVRVHAVSPDSGTLHIMTGRPMLVRPFVGWHTPRQPIVGLAFAGVVDAVGADVTGFAPGDRVAGAAPAAFAEYVVAKPAKLAHVPAGVTLAQASTTPISAVTALQALRDAGRLAAEQRVLIIGAGGGVGSFLTQLAVARGARVTGVASARKADFVRSLGAERVIDYRVSTDPAEWGTFDLVVDAADGRALSVLRRAVTPTGSLVIVGADGAGGPLLDGADRQLRASLLNPLVRQRLVPVIQSERGVDTAIVLDDLASGRITAAIDQVVTLDGAVDLMRRLERREVLGKAVIEVLPENAARERDAVAE